MEEQTYHKAIAFLQNKKSKFQEGVDICNQLEGKYSKFFGANKGAKRGSYAFTLLEERLKRQIRILEQNNPKKKETEVSKETTEQELKEETKEQELKEETTEQELKEETKEQELKEETAKPKKKNKK